MKMNNEEKRRRRRMRRRRERGNGREDGRMEVVDSGCICGWMEDLPL